MNGGGPAWQLRVARVVVLAEWVALAVGILASVIGSEAEPISFVAGGFASVWVLAATALPLSQLRRPLAADAFSLGGVIMAVTAVTLTGGAGSPFFLLSLTPPLHAAVLGGFRSGIGAAALSGLLLVAITLAQQGNVVAALGLAVLYPLLAATVAQIRRILIELEDRAASAEESSTRVTRRLEHLENANSLLARLADIAATDELNPIAIGRAALEAIVERYPGSSGVAALESDNGPILVARHGSGVGAAHENLIPLRVLERSVGYVRLSTPQPLSPEELEGLGTTLRPLALAFSNALLLQEITKSAVKEERTRLARELHDEIGPSLASLGLSLDVALIQGADQRLLADHLSTLRGRVGELVDEVRATVADLRSPSSGSLVTHLETLARELPGNAHLEIDLDERRPSRPSMAPDLHAVVGEAIRNAARHSGGSKIIVRGWVDFDRGRVVVEDDGRGFDPLSVPEGHFGLMGMRERAARSGMVLEVRPSISGTQVSVEWGEP